MAGHIHLCHVYNSDFLPTMTEGSLFWIQSNATHTDKCTRKMLRENKKKGKPELDTLTFFFFNNFRTEYIYKLYSSE